MLKEHKKKLLQDNKEELLVELIREEVELKNDVKKIMYWVYNSAPVDLKVNEIISAAKGMLFILGKMTAKIDKDFKGPEHLIAPSHIHHNMQEPKHLAKIYKDKPDLVKLAKEIMTKASSKDFKCTAQDQRLFQNLCVRMMKELDAHQFEIDSMLKFVGAKAAD